MRSSTAHRKNRTHERLKRTLFISGQNTTQLNQSQRSVLVLQPIVHRLTVKSVLVLQPIVHRLTVKSVLVLQPIVHRLTVKSVLVLQPIVHRLTVKSVLVLQPIVHRLTVSFCSFIKGISPKIRMLCFYPDKQRSFEPFMCLDLVLER